jgi:hypothetical protein
MHLTAAHIPPIVALVAGIPDPYRSALVELRGRHLPYCGRPCRTERDLPFYEVRRGPVSEE